MRTTPQPSLRQQAALLRTGLPPLFVLALAAACAADTSAYDPDWDPGAPAAAASKADGIWDDIPEIAFGKTVTGDVGGDRAEFYQIALHKNDEVKVTMEVTSGDLSPHTSLYVGSNKRLSSEDWKRSGKVLTKTYVAPTTNVYLLAAQAYRNKGEGKYALTIECTGGACAGEFPDAPALFTAGTVAKCFTAARECAFDALPQYGGAVGPARAKSILQGCLDQTTTADAEPCASACEWKNADTSYDIEGKEHCAAIESALIHYADQSAACITFLDGCLDDCFEGGGDPDTFYSSEESLCFASGFNGNCDHYARSLKPCGGTTHPDSGQACYEYCASTFGAQVDDLDSICSYDSNCDAECAVDFDEATAACGTPDPNNTKCLTDWLWDRDGAFVCEDYFNDRL